MRPVYNNDLLCDSSYLDGEKYMMNICLGPIGLMLETPNPETRPPKPILTNSSNEYILFVQCSLVSLTFLGACARNPAQIQCVLLLRTPREGPLVFSNPKPSISLYNT